MCAEEAEIVYRKPQACYCDTAMGTENIPRQIDDLHTVTLKIRLDPMQHLCIQTKSSIVREWQYWKSIKYQISHTLC